MTDPSSREAHRSGELNVSNMANVQAEMVCSEILDAQSGLTLLTRKIACQGLGYPVSQDSNFMTPGGTNFHRYGRPPEMIATVRSDGAIRLTWQDYLSGQVRTTLISEDGCVFSDIFLNAESNSEQPSIMEIGTGQPLTNRNQFCGLLGAVEVSSGVAIATLSYGSTRSADNESEEPAPVVFIHYLHDVTGKHKKSEVTFEKSKKTSNLSPMVWQRSHPMALSTARLGYGHGRLCMHLGLMMRWIDGETAQVGCARTWPLSAIGSTRSPVEPEQESRLDLIGSRSLDQRVTFDKFRGEFVLAALADSFPRAIFLSKFWDRPSPHRVVHKCAGEPGASDPLAELGGLISRRASDTVSYCSADGANPESRDVFVATVPKSMSATPTTLRLTHLPPGTYAICPKLASFQAGMLVAWKETKPTTGQIKACVSILNSAGQVTLPRITSGAIDFHRADDFVTDRTGGVNWFTSDADGIYWHRIFSESNIFS